MAAAASMAVEIELDQGDLVEELPVNPSGRVVVGSVLEAIVLDFPEPAVVFDRRCVCAFMNERGAEALGVNRHEAVGLRVVTLGLPPALEDAIASLTDPAAAPVPAERVVHSSFDNGVRSFRLTLHPERGDVLVTWADLGECHESIRRLALADESRRALRDRILCDGWRRRGALARLATAVEHAAKSVTQVAEEMLAESRGVPPEQPPRAVLVEEAQRLLKVLQLLAQLEREEAAAQAAQAALVET